MFIYKMNPHGRKEAKSLSKCIFRPRDFSSSSTALRENTRICCEAEVDKQTARNAYATESATPESEGMNCFCDKPVSRARFLSCWGQDASPVLFLFARLVFCPESRRPV